MEIIYATTNEGKKRQVQDLLDYNNYDVKIVSLKDIGFKEEIEENRRNFWRKFKNKGRSCKKILR